MGLELRCQCLRSHERTAAKRAPHNCPRLQLDDTAATPVPLVS